MAHSIATLLLRNLSDVFGEIDPVRRRAALEELFHEDAVFYDPAGCVFRGDAAIDHIAGSVVTPGGFSPPRKVMPVGASTTGLRS